jgi:hypothetical protein
MRTNICVTNDSRYVPIVVIMIQLFSSYMTYHRACCKGNCIIRHRFVVMILSWMPLNIFLLTLISERIWSNKPIEPDSFQILARGRGTLISSNCNVHHKGHNTWLILDDTVEQFIVRI